MEWVDDHHWINGGYVSDEQQPNELGVVTKRYVPRKIYKKTDFWTATLTDSNQIAVGSQFEPNVGRTIQQKFMNLMIALVPAFYLFIRNIFQWSGNVLCAFSTHDSVYV